MQLTIKIKLVPTKEQEYMLSNASKEYIRVVNTLVSEMVEAKIRNSARTSRKNEKNLHAWSFYRLAKYIEYKATLEGIKVEYVYDISTQDEANQLRPVAIYILLIKLCFQKAGHFL